MKKAILMLVVAVGLTVSAASCGGKASVKTQQDSLAYALGIDIGNGLWNRIDSTMNPKLVAKGISEVFAKKANMTEEEARMYIQYYMTEVAPKLKAEKNEAEAAECFKALEKNEQAKKSETGLVTVIENPGEGLQAELGDTLTVHYTLYTISGTKLESSLDRGQPMTYTNSASGMIAGFTEGVNQLKEGGKSTLYLPYNLAYGEDGNGAMGPKQALKFEVELVKVVKPATAPEATK